MAIVVIDSTPQGAEVIGPDKKSLGKTPVKLSLPISDLPLDVRAAARRLSQEDRSKVVVTGNTVIKCRSTRAPAPHRHGGHKGTGRQAASGDERRRPHAARDIAAISASSRAHARSPLVAGLVALSRPRISRRAPRAERRRRRASGAIDEARVQAAAEIKAAELEAAAQSASDRRPRRAPRRSRRSRRPTKRSPPTRPRASAARTRCAPASADIDALVDAHRAARGAARRDPARRPVASATARAASTHDIERKRERLRRASSRPARASQAAS